MIKSFQTSCSLPVCILVMFFLILSESGLNAQNTVGIGTASPNANAVLDLVSPTGNQGLLIPRISTVQRQAMTSSLSTAETGLIVYDLDLNQFFHWVDTSWIVGLGAFSDVAGGDLQGNYPNPILRPDVVNSNTILDGSVSTPDYAGNSITIGKVNAEGNVDAFLGTDATGNPIWEAKSNFLTNGLADSNIMIGDASNIAQPQVVSGDISLANDGTATIADDAITSAKILDDAIAAADIGTDAVGSDELATGSVTSDEIVDGAITTVDLADNSVDSNKIQDNSITSADIASGGNNKVLITTAAGTVFWENITLFETSTLAEGNIFVGDVTNTAAALNASGVGRILIGDGTSVQSLNVAGDISLSAAGDAQINPGTVGSPEVQDNSLSRDDIGPDAIESSELADNAVDNPAIQDNAVSNSKIQDGAISNQKISSDAVTSTEIADGTIATQDLADNAVSTAKIDGEGTVNTVLTTTSGGSPQWESRANFGTSNLPNANLFIGDVAGISQPRPVSGDISLSTTGNVQINNDVIGTNEVIDNSLTVDDIGPNAVEASELADNAVDIGAIQTDAVTTPKITDNAVTVAKISGGGNNDAILTTDAGGNPQWEAKSGLDTDPLNEIQDLGNVLSQGNDAGGSAIVNASDPTNPQDLATKSYVDALDAADNDSDPTNEIQDLSLAGNTLSVTGDATTVDLSGYLDNTDNQDLSLAGNTLSITGDATTVDLSGYLDNTDSQDLGSVLSQGNNAGGVKIINVADPTNPQDVATMTYVDNITITGANLSSNSVNSSNIVNGSITSADIGAGEVSTSDMQDGAINSAKIQDLSIVDIDISNSANISATKLQSIVMVEGENVSLLNNDAGYLTTVNSADITDGTVVDADVSTSANIAATKLQSTVMVEGENVSLLNNDAGYLTTVNSAVITDGTVVDADVSNSANIASTKLQSTVMVEGENVSLLNNDTGYLTTVNSADISDGTVVDADVSNSANIASTKLQNTVMVESENVSLLNNDAGYLTTVNSADIADGSIVDADINGSAAIDGSKVNPDFGSQNIQTSGTLNSGAATVSSLTVTSLGASSDTYTGDGAVNSFTISAGGAFSSSDVRLKSNIKNIPRALDKINLVEGKSYTFKNDQNENIHFGVIAQDLQKLFPNLVRENEDGFLSVNYLELIPVLVEALKEQQVTIQQLAQTIKQGQELNKQLEASLKKQQQLVRAQQFVLTQLQMDREAMKKDIKEIRQSLGLEAKQ